MILNSPYISGSSTITGNLTVLGTITGSTNSAISASYALNATSASYALNATSASFATNTTTSSFALNSTSASYALNATTSSFALNATTSSFALASTSASYSTTAATASFADTFTVAGTLTAQKLVVQTITSSIVYSSGSNVFGNSVSNTQSMTGSVGISGSLAVVGAGTFSNSVSIINNATTETKFAFSNQNNASGAIGVKAAVANNANVIYTSDLGGHIFETGTTERMCITPSGSVGIGTTTPSASLDVSAGTSTGIVNLSGGSGGGTNVGQLTFNRIGTGELARIETIRNGGNDAGQLQFYTKPTAGSLATRMVIDTTGNVGIGTTTPATAGGSFTGLDVRGSSGGSLIMGSTSTLMSYIYADSTALTLQTTGSIPILFVPAGTERMRISSAGNVGIGTTTPETLLHVNSSNAGGEGGYIYLDNPAASTLNNKSGIKFGTSSGASFSTTPTGEISNIVTNAGTGASDLTFGTFNGSSSGERMRITSGGNVGIGTTSPTGQLSLANQISNGSTPVASYAATNGVNGQNFLNGYYAGNTDGFGTYPRYLDIVSVGSPDGTNGGSNIRFFTNPIANSSPAVERMRISSGGNVGIANTGYSNTRVTITGIGTTSANYGLVVNNSSNSNLFLVRDDGAVQITSFTTNGLIGTSASGNMSVVNSTYTEIDTGTITYSMTSGAPWGINNSFPATIRNYIDEGMAGSTSDAEANNINRGVTFDLGSAKAVRRIVERGYDTKNLDQITVQYSTDNSNWTTIFIYPNVYSNTQKVMDFNPTGAISARYWRWLISGWTIRHAQNYYTYEAIIYT
jgi:hypothetical protein